MGEEDPFAHRGAELRPDDSLHGAVHGGGEVPAPGGAGAADVPPVRPPPLHWRRLGYGRDDAVRRCDDLVSSCEACESSRAAVTSSASSAASWAASCAFICAASCAVSCACERFAARAVQSRASGRASEKRLKALIECGFLRAAVFFWLQTRDARPTAITSTAGCAAGSRAGGAAGLVAGSFLSFGSRR